MPLLQTPSAESGRMRISQPSFTWLRVAALSLLSIWLKGLNPSPGRVVLLCTVAHPVPDGSRSSAGEELRGNQTAISAIPAHLFPEGGSWPSAQGPGFQPLPAMLLLWVSVVAALALAAPAPRTNGQRRGAAQAWPYAPNVVLVVSDSFVSTERRREEDGGARRSKSATSLQSSLRRWLWGAESETFQHVLPQCKLRNAFHLEAPYTHTYTS